MKEILGWLGGGLALALSWFFSWWKIRNLKAQNKTLEKERDYEKTAKDVKTEEGKQLREVDGKTDDDVFNSWNKNQNEKKK